MEKWNTGDTHILWELWKYGPSKDIWKLKILSVLWKKIFYFLLNDERIIKITGNPERFEQRWCASPIYATYVLEGGQEVHW